eukprot:6987063-Pyramimonas_sp.AAC.1
MRAPFRWGMCREAKRESSTQTTVGRTSQRLDPPGPLQLVSRFPSQQIKRSGCCVGCATTWATQTIE